MVGTGGRKCYGKKVVLTAKVKRKLRKNETEQESFERMLKEFNHKVNQEKILKETRDRMYYTKPSDQRRAYKRKLRKRFLRKQRNQQWLMK